MVTSGPRYRCFGPMSRCVSLYQAFENARVNRSKSARKRSHMARYSGSTLSAMSEVIIMSGFI